ncbi:MAG: HlyD family secretion protein [Kofleriaceae bacterium]
MPTEDVLTPPDRKPRRKAPIVAGTLVSLGAAVGLIYWVTSRGKENTDDAQVEGHVSPVAARVTGQVKKVLVQDNQRVKTGDILVELDDADYAARAASARADLAAAQAQLHSSQATLDLTHKTLDANLAIARGGVAQASAVSGSTQAMIDQAKADVAAAESRLELAKTEQARTQRLVDQGAIPKSELDARNDQLQQAQAAISAAKARVVTAETGRANSSGTSEAAHGRLLIAQAVPEQIAVVEAQVELAKAKVDQAAAALRTAELNLGYTKVRAEVDGVVSKRTVEVGQLVSPDRSLLALVDDRDTWVVANFKETQLAHMKAGEKVKIKIDGFDDATLQGTVESIQAGTGSRFSLLPPDNASGNFTKVTQRVPVKVVLTDHKDLALRPGMSADVTVYTE